MSRNDQPGRGNENMRKDDMRTGKVPAGEPGTEDTRVRTGQLTDEEVEQQQAANKPAGMQKKKGNQPR
jgi:hypothetical protein